MYFMNHWIISMLEETLVRYQKHHYILCLRSSVSLSLTTDSFLIDHTIRTGKINPRIYINLEIFVHLHVKFTYILSNPLEQPASSEPEEKSVNSLNMNLWCNAQGTQRTSITRTSCVPEQFLTRSCGRPLQERALALESDLNVSWWLCSPKQHTKPEPQFCHLKMVIIFTSLKLL